MTAEYRTKVPAQQSDIPAPPFRDNGIELNSRIQWFNAQLPDEVSCLLTGVAVSDKTIVICDNENKYLKRFTLDGKFVDKLLLIDPCGVCFLPNSFEIAITEPDAQRITYCSTESRLAITSISPAQKKYECIAVLDDVKLVVGCCELGSSCIDIIDCDANILRSIRNTADGIRLFRSPSAVACLHSNEIVISDPGGGSLVCYSLTDGVQFRFDPKGRPSGLCVDSENGIYMAQYDSNSVFRLSRKGTKELVVADNRFKLKSPLAMAYNNNNHIVLTEEMPSSRVLVIKLDVASGTSQERQDTSLSLSNVGLGLDKDDNPICVAN